MAGEASTIYAYAPLVSGVTQRMVAFDPQARFVYKAQSAKCRAHLRTVQTRQTEKLGALLKRFPEWHTLQGEEHCTCWRVSNAV